MFNTATVFVLGAGVSEPFGFPSGQSLIKEICGHTQGQQNQMKKLLSQAAPRHKKKIDPFFRHLGRTPIRSIDRWLEASPSFVDLGKCAIAYVIANAEREAPFRPVKGRHLDWFEWLWNALQTDHVTGLKSNRIWFVTFNYDRLLEYKLTHAVHDSYADASYAEKAQAVNDLHNKIIHVHGALSSGLKSAQDFGDVPALKLCHADPSLYKEAGRKVAKYARGIKIVSEKIEESGVFGSAHLAMKQAQRVIFLGFGYERRNVERLNPATHLLTARMSPAAFEAMSILNAPLRGSAMGMETGEKESVIQQLGRMIKLDDDELDAVTFCRRNVIP